MSRVVSFFVTLFTRAAWKSAFRAVATAALLLLPVTLGAHAVVQPGPRSKATSGKVLST